MRAMALLAAIILAAMPATWASADTGTGSSSATSSTTNTRWKGCDVNSLASTTKFFLYNVGTGRFLMQGGYWGTQGMLLYQDYGAGMYLVSDYTDKYNTTPHKVIHSGASSLTDVTGKAINGVCLGINYPAWTTLSTSTFASTGAYVIFDGQPFGTTGKNETSGDGYSREWTFKRVEGDNSTSDVYTYYMQEVIHSTNQTLKNTPKKLWLGAVYGHATFDQNTAKTYVGDNTTAFYDAADGITPTADSLNYQWRLVPITDVEAMLTNTDADAYGGLNSNLSYLLSDPNFDHNRTQEFRKRTVTSTAAAGTTYRYDWPNSTSKANVSADNTLTDATQASQPWNAAVMRKLQVNGRENGIYSFGEFEGIGRVEQSFTAPATGRYLIQWLAAYQGNAPTLYAQADGKETTTVPALITDATFKKCTQAATANSSDVYPVTVSAEADWAKLSQEITSDPNRYMANVVIYATKGQTITIGLRKDAATQSRVANKVNGKAYYYDTDFAIVDNISVHFYGDDAMILDEDAKSTDYMKQKETNVNVLLKRKLTLGQWNTLVLPITVTMAQLKAAFGDDVELAKLQGVGTISGVSTDIDYRKVTLTADGDAIEPGSFYLIKTNKDRTHISYSTSEQKSIDGYFYLIGRRSFDWTTVLPSIASEYHGEGNNYEHGKVKATGTYITLPNGCPAGSYVFSNGNMYHTQSAKTIKGFRYWLSDASEASPSKELMFNLLPDNSVPTAISTVKSRHGQTNNLVYRVDGRVVRVYDGSLNGLPQGIYIVNGKKYSVK